MEHHMWYFVSLCLAVVSFVVLIIQLFLSKILIDAVWINSYRSRPAPYILFRKTSTGGYFWGNSKDVSRVLHDLMAQILPQLKRLQINKSAMYVSKARFGGIY